MQALREGTSSEGTRITPRTPKRLAIPRLHWLRRMGVTELVLICILQQKERTEDACFSQDLHNIYTLLNWKVSLLNLGWPSHGSPTTAFPSRNTSLCTQGTQGPAGSLAQWLCVMCSHREEGAPCFWEASTSRASVGGWGSTPGLRPAACRPSTCTCSPLPGAAAVKFTKRYLVAASRWKWKARSVGPNLIC